MIPIREKLTAERTVRLRSDDDWRPSPGVPLILEFFTRNRVSNGVRMAEILATFGIGRDSFFLDELRERIPRYELAPDVVQALNKSGHALPGDGLIPALTLTDWCSRDRLNRVDGAWDVRAIVSFLRARDLEIAAVEAGGEIAALLAQAEHSCSSLEDYLELLDLVDCHSVDPLRILVNTRDR